MRRHTHYQGRYPLLQFYTPHMLKQLQHQHMGNI